MNQASKNTYKNNGIIKLKLLNPNYLRNYRKKIVNLIKTSFNLQSAIDERCLTKLESADKELWSGIYKNMLCMEEIFFIIKNCFSVAKNSTFGLKNPVLCNTPNIKINFPSQESHNLDVHQDIHSHMGSLNSITIWIPLQATKSIMGPIAFLPGSHNNILPAKNGLLKDRFKDQKFTTLDLNLGECLVFSQLLVHKSKENKSKKARVSLQIRFNDLDAKEWLNRKYYSVEKKIREKPPKNIQKIFSVT